MCAYFQQHRASYTDRYTITIGPACSDTHTQSVQMLYTIHFFCVYLCDSSAWFRNAFHVKLIWLQWCGKELLYHSFPFHSYQIQSSFFLFIWTLQTMKQQQMWAKYKSAYFLFRFSLIVCNTNLALPTNSCIEVFFFGGRFLPLSSSNILKTRKFCLPIGTLALPFGNECWINCHSKLIILLLSSIPFGKHKNEWYGMEIGIGKEK